MKKGSCAHTESASGRRTASSPADLPVLADTDVCLLPGPVALSAPVRAALLGPSLYHRSEEFVALFEEVRERLNSITGARDVALFVGSGTLANDVVAATLAATRIASRGLILENGEFGRRLVAQAARFGLAPRVLSWPWGSTWDVNELALALDQVSGDGWVWGVHHESSTGVLNDLPHLMRLSRQRGVRVCVDCVSSIGAVPLDLSEVFLASGTSGKALGACSGIAMVFADRDYFTKCLDTSRIPTYFDLPAALGCRGPCFTFPSTPLQALAAALTNYDTLTKSTTRYQCYAALGRYVRQRLRELGLPPLAAECQSGPTITTFTPPTGWTSQSFVSLCRNWGFLIAGQSGYLAESCLVQIATMGATTKETCQPLFERLELMQSGHARHEIRPCR
jgi:aspartate aminotransferase-like enzyme